MRLTTSAFLKAALLGSATVLALPAIVAVPLAPALARSAPDSFADLAEKLLPAVVNISSSQTIQAKGGKQEGGPEAPMFPPGSPFDQFFKDFMNRNRPRGGGGGGNSGEPPPERKAQSLGSGFIIDSAGLIVTNNHVIDGADEINVILHDNTTLKATLVGRDESGDIALLRVKPDKPLPAVAFGDSEKARVGDWVLAIGNPFGLGGSVTAGIVSARNRNIRSGPYDDFIQTDAAINQGNSGGPLFNMDGEVIGMNTAIYSRSGGSVGIGFSIPSKMVKTIVAQLKDVGHPVRGWLGVRIQQVTPDIAESVGLKEATGAMVAGVNDGGPADKAKLRNGDIILKFNGQDVKDMPALPRIVAESEVGKQVPIVVWRDSKEVTLSATLAEKPSEAELAAAETGGKGGDTTKPVELVGLGLKIAAITPDLKEKLQLGDDQKGVAIVEVSPNGAAAERGLKPGDAIVEVQQTAVSTPDDVKKRIDAVRKENRKSVLMLVQGRDGLRWVPLSLSADKDKDKKPG
ncbi:MAG: DegQ family serine endoprotease [Rhodospirillales bacterium]